MTLTGANTFSGGLSINGGTLVAGSVGALGTGLATLGAGGELALGVNGSFNNGLSLGAGACGHAVGRRWHHMPRSAAG